MYSTLSLTWPSESRWLRQGVLGMLTFNLRLTVQYSTDHNANSVQSNYTDVIRLWLLSLPSYHTLLSQPLLIKSLNFICLFSFYFPFIVSFVLHHCTWFDLFILWCCSYSAAVIWLWFNIWGSRAAVDQLVDQSPMNPRVRRMTPCSTTCWGVT